MRGAASTGGNDIGQIIAIGAVILIIYELLANRVSVPATGAGAATGQTTINPFGSLASLLGSTSTTATSNSLWSALFPPGQQVTPLSTTLGAQSTQSQLLDPSLVQTPSTLGSLPSLDLLGSTGLQGLDYAQGPDSNFAF